MANARPPPMRPDAPPTMEEVAKLSKGFKDAKFRSHFDTYVDEISDPQHRAEYEEYLRDLEAKGELPDGCELLRADPGMCVETSLIFSGGQTQKCYINIVVSEALQEIEVTTDANGNQNVKLPYSLGPPRPDRDTSNQVCMTADFAVSVMTFQRARQQQEILKVFVDLATQNLQGNFLKGHEKISSDFKIVKDFQCKGGTPYPMNVRSDMLKPKYRKAKSKKIRAAKSDVVTPGELKKIQAESKERLEREWGEEQDAEEEEKPKHIEEITSLITDDDGTSVRVPEHRLVYVGSFELTDFMHQSVGDEAKGSRASDEREYTQQTFTVPQEMKLVVTLPGVASAADIGECECTESTFVLEAGRWFLDIAWPYEVDGDKAKAKFEKKRGGGILTITAKVTGRRADAADEGVMLEGGWEPVVDVTAGAAPAKSAEAEAQPEGEASAAEPSAETRAEQSATDKLEDQRAHKDRIDEPSPEEEEEEEEPIVELGDFSAPTSMQTPAAMPEPTSLTDEALAQAQQGQFRAIVPDASEQPAAFLKADEFSGPKDGYVFKTGARGLGYYLDVSEEELARAAATAAPTGSPPVEVAPRLTAESIAAHTKRAAAEEVQRELPSGLVDPTLVANVPTMEASARYIDVVDGFVAQTARRVAFAFDVDFEVARVDVCAVQGWAYVRAESSSGSTSAAARLHLSTALQHHLVVTKSHADGTRVEVSAAKVAFGGAAARVLDWDDAAFREALLVAEADGRTDAGSDAGSEADAQKKAERMAAVPKAARTGLSAGESAATVGMGVALRSRVWLELM